jgi:Transposase
MAARRRHDGDEFKREAVQLGTEQGNGMSETARNLGINAHMLGRWKREVEAHRVQPFPETVVYRPPKKNYSGYARTLSGFGWNVTFSKKPWAPWPAGRIEVGLYSRASGHVAGFGPVRGAPRQS